jgi:hypothetical protein
LPLQVVVAVDVGKIEQAAQAEVVGQAAVEQVDVGTGGAVLIGRGVAGEGFGIVAGARRRRGRRAGGSDQGRGRRSVLA